MENTIEHSGLVESIQDTHVKVRILQTSACSGCKIASHCNASEMKVKTVDVYTENSSDYVIGQPVVVVGSTSMGWFAVLLSFGVPFVVMFVVLVLCLESFGLGEGISGIISLLSLVPYYSVIYAIRDRLGKKFTFCIKPINKQ